jgi:hypothetical protein
MALHLLYIYVLAGITDQHSKFAIANRLVPMHDPITG